MVKFWVLKAMEIHTVVLCFMAPAWQMNTDVSEKHDASTYSARVTLTFTAISMTQRH